MTEALNSFLKQLVNISSVCLELTAIIIIMILFAFSGYFNFTSSEEPVIEHITPEEFSRYLLELL